MSYRYVSVQAEREGTGMQDLSLEYIIAFHRKILSENEQADLRIISEGNLHQLVFRVTMTDDPFSRAALAFWSLCAYPAFREGNRRTAHRLAEEILMSAGCRVKLPCPDVRVLVKGIDDFTIEPEDVEQVFRNAAVPISPSTSER
ncbi:MAG TPA: hypothetical protein VHN82_06455 [Methanoregula sp.]|nr:hypothetical protein [Methanoregula sp.]